MIMLGKSLDFYTEMAFKKNTYLWKLCASGVWEMAWGVIPSIGRLLCYLFGFNKNYL